MKINKEKLAKVNEWSKKVYWKTRPVRDKLLTPILGFLVKHDCKPVQVSLLRLVLILPTVLLVGFNDWLACLFILINLVLDGVDGALARKLNQETKKGKILDISIDNFFIVFLVLAFIHAKYLDGFWGAAYLAVYLLNFLFKMSLAEKTKSEFPFFRNTYQFYIIYPLLLLTGWNWFDYGAVFFGIYMFVEDGFLFFELINLF